MYGSTVKVGENIAMDKNNLGNEGQNNSIPDKERKDGNKKKTESFEIIIRGSEIYRINARTKEVVQVFQCVDHCLRGNKTDELYSGDFKLPASCKSAKSRFTSDRITGLIWLIKSQDLWRCSHS